MILVDTSVWIDHLRTSDTQLVNLLNDSKVCIHPMIIGELACGNLRKRDELLSLWQQLPLVAEATHQEVLFTIEQQALMGKGLGYIDTHLLTSALLQPDTQLWTRDKRLHLAARQLHIAFKK